MPEKEGSISVGRAAVNFIKPANYWQVILSYVAAIMSSLDCLKTLFTPPFIKKVIGGFSGIETWIVCVYTVPKQFVYFKNSLCLISQRNIYFG